MGSTLQIVRTTILASLIGTSACTSDESGEGGPSIEGPRLQLVAGETTSGFVDGVGRAARFAGISCLELSGDGRALYAADTFNGTVRQIDTSTGEVTTIGGVAQSFSTSDGVGDAVRFTEPRGLGLSPDGRRLWVADGPALRSLDLAEGEATTWAGLPSEPGDIDGDAVEARLGFLIHDLAVSDDGGVVYLADRSNDRIRAWRVDDERLEAFAGGAAPGTDGTGASAGFSGPGGLSMANGQLYVADTFSHTLRRIDLDDATVSTVAGLSGVSGSVDGPVADARLDTPQGVAWLPGDGPGTLLAAGFDGTVRDVDLAAGVVGTRAGVSGETRGLDGDASVARLGGAFASVVADAERGLVYYADLRADSVRVLTLADGSVRTLAGPVEPEGQVDGPLDAARFGWLFGAASTQDGSVVFLADPSFGAIRRVNVAEARVDTLDVGAFSQPVGLALDEAAGVLYASDAAAGTVSAITLAGGSREVIAEGLADPWGLAIGDGVLYVAEYGGARVSAVALDGSGARVLAGSGADAAGGSARFAAPLSVALAPERGVLYVSDFEGHALYAVDVDGGETTRVAGDGTAGTNDGVPGRLDGPSGIAWFEGRLLVADTNNHTLRVFNPAAGALTTTLGRPGLEAAIGPGPGVAAAEATLAAPEALAISADGLFITVEYALLRLDLGALDASPR